MMQWRRWVSAREGVRPRDASSAGRQVPGLQRPGLAGRRSPTGPGAPGGRLRSQQHAGGPGEQSAAKALGPASVLAAWGGAGACDRWRPSAAGAGRAQGGGRGGGGSRLRHQRPRGPWQLRVTVGAAWPRLAGPGPQHCLPRPRTVPPGPWPPLPGALLPAGQRPRWPRRARPRDREEAARPGSP